MFNLLKRVLNCINNENKTKLFYIQIFTLFVALLNVLSSIIIAPFIAILSGKNLEIDNYFFKKVNSLIEYFNFNDILFSASILLVSLYSLSILLSVLLNYFNLKWIQSTNIYMTKILYNYFLHKNWIFHSSNSSKDLTSKIHNQTERMTAQIILPFIDFFSSFIISLFIVIAIFFVDYKVAIFTTFISSLFYLFFYFFFKKKLRYTGDQLTKIYPDYFRSLYEGFFSIKDTELFNKKEYFSKEFSRNIKKRGEMTVLQEFLISLPRSFVEILFFSLLLSFIFVMLKIYNFNFVDIASLMAFYGICAIKIIPSLQKIFKSISSINANKSAFFDLEFDLLDANKFKKLDNKILSKEKINLKSFIKLNDVSFKYPSNKKNVLESVNMKIPFGSKVGIVGKTGSGKSTLIDIILGFLQPQSGELIIDETKINEKNRSSWQLNLSYVPQTFFISEASIKSNIAFGEKDEFINKQKLMECLKIAELNEFINNEDKFAGESGKQLSGGQKQRLGIARAIYKNSEILVLDEATSSLDTITERKIIKNLQNHKKIKTLIIISHRFETLKMCDKLFFVDNKRVKEVQNFEELSNLYEKI